MHNGIIEQQKQDTTQTRCLPFYRLLSALVCTQCALQCVHSRHMCVQYNTTMYSDATMTSYKYSCTVNEMIMHNYFVFCFISMFFSVGSACVFFFDSVPFGSVCVWLACVCVCVWHFIFIGSYRFASFHIHLPDNTFCRMCVVHVLSATSLKMLRRHRMFFFVV